MEAGALPLERWRGSWRSPLNQQSSSTDLAGSILKLRGKLLLLHEQ
jgi:hypothetical protein